MIQRISFLGTSPVLVARLLSEEKEEGIRQSLLLALGDCDPFNIPGIERAFIVDDVMELYRSNRDPGIHSAARWMLRQPLWKESKAVEEADENFRAAAARGDGEREWFVNSEGQTFLVVTVPQNTDLTEFSGAQSPVQVTKSSYRLAISADEVTVHHFARFRKDQQPNNVYAPGPACPMNNVSWYDAVAYCNWLTDQENERVGNVREKLLRCYEPLIENGKEVYSEGMTIPSDILNRTGYRLPTEFEWEFVCRAGTKTAYSFGESDELLRRYAWYAENSKNVTSPVGHLRPNLFGVFDMHGNVDEWCQDIWSKNGENAGSVVKNNDSRVLRGGSFRNQTSGVRSGYRGSLRPGDRYSTSTFGFRPARTYR